MSRRYFRTATAGAFLVVTGILILLLLEPAPPPIISRHEVGISTSSTLLRMDDFELDNRLNDIKNLGANWIRVDFSWPSIQPSNPTDYVWEKYDRVVRQAGTHNMKIMAVLDYTPLWARDPTCQTLAKSEESAQKCSPRNSEEFGHFAGAVAARYHKQSVRGWEIWNEPNLSAYWKSVQANNTIFVDPVAYAKVANTAATQIRRYSDGVIITGGLSPLFEPSVLTGMRQSDYLSQLLPQLTPSLFDGVGIHPYSWPVLPGKAASYNAFYTVDNGQPDYNLRAIMDSNGWSDKQIWATEFGASTEGLKLVKTPTAQNRPDHVTEDAQAQIDSQGVTNWYTKSNVGVLFIHSDSDQWLTSRANEGGFGIRRSDGTKKPAYDAVKESIQKIGK